MAFKSAKKEWMKTLFLALIFWGTSNICFAQSHSNEVELERLKRKVDLLNRQNLNLNSALTTAKQNEEKLKSEVEQLAERLSAYGLYEGSKDERLLKAVSDSRLLNKQISSLRLVSDELAISIRNFVTVAKVEDSRMRQQVEVALRKFDRETMGLNQKKGELDEFGSVQSAKVISIDSSSGMLVINIGLNQNARLGAEFQLLRGDKELGKGRIVEVRDNVAGILVVTKVHKDIVFKIGDSSQIVLQKG